MSLHKDIKDLLEHKLDDKKLDTFQYLNLLESKFRELIIQSFKPKEEIKQNYFDVGLLLKNNLRLFFEIKMGDTFSYTDVVLKITSLINSKQILSNDIILLLVKDKKFQHLVKLRDNYKILDNVIILSFETFLDLIERISNITDYESYIPNILDKMKKFKLVSNEELNTILSYKEDKYVRDFFLSLSSKFLDILLSDNPDAQKIGKKGKIDLLMEKYNNLKDLEELKTKIYEGYKKSKLFYIKSSKNKQGYNVFDLAEAIRCNVLFFDFVKEDKLIKFSVKEENLNCIFYFNHSILEIQSDNNKSIKKVIENISACWNLDIKRINFDLMKFIKEGLFKKYSITYAKLYNKNPSAIIRAMNYYGENLQKQPNIFEDTLEIQKLIIEIHDLSIKLDISKDGSIRIYDKYVLFSDMFELIKKLKLLILN